MKNIRSVIAALSMACLFFAVQVSAKKTISYMCWVADADNVKANQKMAAQFEKEHPDIKIKLNCVYWPGETGYMNKLLTMAAGNLAPDVVAMPFFVFPASVESGIITDLSPYLKRDKSVKLTDWYTVGTNSGKWNGKYYGLPTYGSAWWVHYNKRAFAEAGLTEPEKLYESGDWTIDAMAEMSRKTTKIGANGKHDKVGIITYWDIVACTPWIRGMGADWFNEAKGQCATDNEATTKGIQYIYDLVYKKKSMSLSGCLPYNHDMHSMAKHGKVAMVPWWDSMAGQLNEMKLSWSVNLVPFPKGPANADNINAQIHVLTISKQSKNKDAALEYVKFLAGDEGSKVYATDFQWLTTRKSTQKIYKESHLGDGLERTQPDPRHKKMSLILPLVNEQLMKIWSGKAEPMVALKDAAKNSNAVLSRKK